MCDEKSAFEICGQRFVLRLTLGSARRLADECDVNVLAAPKDNGLGLVRLFTDPLLLSDVVWRLIESAASFTRQEFDDALDGDVLWSMQQAFEVAVRDFFRGSPSVLKRIEAGLKMADEMQTRLIEKAQGEMSQKLTTLATSTPGPSDSNSGESSD